MIKHLELDLAKLYSVTQKISNKSTLIAIIAITVGSVSGRIKRKYKLQRLKRLASCNLLTIASAIQVYVAIDRSKERERASRKWEYAICDIGINRHASFEIAMCKAFCTLYRDKEL